MKITMRLSAVSLGVAAALGSVTSFAATEHEAIVVVATRQASRVNHVAADVTVLEREQIEQAGPNSTLGDLLARSAGVEMSRTGGRGAAEGLFLRGANSGHTLVLIDGMRVSSATLGETAIDALPLSQLERIEVLRGPASAMYGSDAIGGVLNITTRRGKNAPKFDFGVGLGSRGAQELSLGHAGRVGALDYSVRLAESKAKGVNAITNPSSPAFNADEDGFWRQNFSLNAVWQATPETELGGAWLESDGVNRFDTSWPTAVANWQDRKKVSNQTVYAKTRLLEYWESEFRIANSENASVTTPSQTVGQTEDLFRTKREQWVWQNNFKLPLGQGLAALETLREEIESSKVFTNTQRNTDSLVLGWSGSQAAHFWQLGARRDVNSQYGGKNTETMAYGYRFNESWRLSGSVGTSFKAPTFNDLYFPNTPFVGAGNAALQPESGKSRELALRYAQSGVEASLTVFRNDVKNLIQWEESPAGSWFYVPRNVGQAHISGWAATWHSRHDAWLLDANVNGQVPKDAATAEYLVRRARNFGSLAVTREEGPWRLGGEVQVKSERYDAPDFTTRRNTSKMGGYGVLNLHGEYRVSEAWTLVGRIDNLFDRQYELARSSSAEFNSLSRTVFLGARFSLK